MEQNIVCRLQESCVVLSPTTPQGYGANLNLGVKALDEEVTCFVLPNDDVVFEPRSLTALLDALSDPRAGIVGPSVVWPDGRSTHPESGLPSVIEAFNRQAAVLPRPLWKGMQERSRSRNRAPKATITAVPGAVQFVRREAFDAVSGFDEDFSLCYEEIDFFVRVTQAGWSLGWAENAVVSHTGGSSIPSEQSRSLAAQDLATLLTSESASAAYDGCSSAACSSQSSSSRVSTPLLPR